MANLQSKESESTIKILCTFVLNKENLKILINNLVTPKLGQKDKYLTSALSLNCFVWK